MCQIPAPRAPKTPVSERAVASSRVQRNQTGLGRQGEHPQHERAESELGGLREEVAEVAGRLVRLGGGDRRRGGINGVQLDASRGRSQVRFRGVHNLFRAVLSLLVRNRTPDNWGLFVVGLAMFILPWLGGGFASDRGAARTVWVAGFPRNGIGGAAGWLSDRRDGHQRERSSRHRAQRARLDQ
jgi:hypothetical protein